MPAFTIFYRIELNGLSAPHTGHDYMNLEAAFPAVKPPSRAIAKFPSCAGEKQRGFLVAGIPDAFAVKLDPYERISLKRTPTHDP